MVTENTDLGCVELNYEGITYRPYGIIISSKLKGKQIGIRENTPDCKIYEVKGYDNHEWILDYLDVFMESSYTLFKSIEVTNIPNELAGYKEYDF